MSAYIHRGLVYFVACGQYVKIGYTASSLERRMARNFTTGVAVPDDLDRTRPLEVLRTIPGCIVRDERRIHGLFAAHHVVGEWRRLSPAFLVQLQRLQYVTDAEVLARFRAVRRDLKRARVSASPRAA